MAPGISFSDSVLMKPFRIAACSLAAVFLSAVPAHAQDSEVPYWASIKVDEVNMRVGPATSYRIAWVYKRKDLPLKVIRRQEGWRLVVDPDGDKGWVLGRFLSLKKTAIVHGNGVAQMREKPDGTGALLWRLQPGVSGLLGKCDSGWCRLEVSGRRGYVKQGRLWGAGEP